MCCDFSKTTILTSDIITGFTAHGYLLNLIKCMEKDYFDCISEAPNRRKWEILADEGIRVLKDVTVNHVETLGSDNYIALTSFHVQAAPLLLFQFLVKRNFQLQVNCYLYKYAKLISIYVES
jgi:hypothetical protein